MLLLDASDMSKLPFKQRVAGSNPARLIISFQILSSASAVGWAPVVPNFVPHHSENPGGRGTGG